MVVPIKVRVEYDLPDDYTEMLMGLWGDAGLSPPDPSSLVELGYAARCLAKAFDVPVEELLRPVGEIVIRSLTSHR